MKDRQRLNWWDGEARYPSPATETTRPLREGLNSTTPARVAKIV
jgi:hypothetical protein